MTSIATVPGDETLTVRVAPEPPLAERDNTVPVGRIFVCATAVAPAPCAADKVSAVALAIVLIFLFAFPVMWLWNALIPQLFQGPVLGFWQTFGLLVLVRLILPSSAKTNAKSSN